MLLVYSVDLLLSYCQFGGSTSLSEPFYLFILINQYTWFIWPQSSDPLKKMESCLKVPDMKTSLKQQGDGENLNLDRQLKGCASPQDLTSNQAPASAFLAINDFVTTLSRSLLAFLISFYSYQALIHLY